jgi:competence protein ComFC
MKFEQVMPFALSKSWLDAIASFLYPEVCQICNQEPATPGNGFVGDICRKNVTEIVPPFCERCGLAFEGDITSAFECSNCRTQDYAFTYARSAALARTTLLDIIHRYKYSRALWFEPFLGELFAAAAAPVLLSEQWDMIVPVPLHPFRQAEREFNQAEALARHLANSVTLPLDATCLRRVKETDSQTRLTRTQRAENVRTAFAFNHRASEAVAGKRVILVDDVFTTGATTNACAKLLRKHGAEAVCVWTLARGAYRPE